MSPKQKLVVSKLYRSFSILVFVFIVIAGGVAIEGHWYEFEPPYPVYSTQPEIDQSTTQPEIDESTARSEIDEFMSAMAKLDPSEKAKADITRDDNLIRNRNAEKKHFKDNLFRLAYYLILLVVGLAVYVAAVVFFKKWVLWIVKDPDSKIE